MTHTTQPQPDDIVVENNQSFLVGSECPDCGERSFPARPRCPACRAAQQESVRFDRTATVESYTEIHTPSEQFEPPYLVAFIRLSPDDIRTFTPLLDATLEDIDIGSTVELRVGRTKDGEPIWGFVPHSEVQT